MARRKEKGEELKNENKIPVDYQARILHWLPNDPYHFEARQLERGI